MFDVFRKERENRNHRKHRKFRRSAKLQKIQNIENIESAYIESYLLHYIASNCSKATPSCWISSSIKTWKRWYTSCWLPKTQSWSSIELEMSGRVRRRTWEIRRRWWTTWGRSSTRSTTKCWRNSRVCGSRIANSQPDWITLLFNHLLLLNYPTIYFSFCLGYFMSLLFI